MPKTVSKQKLKRQKQKVKKQLAKEKKKNKKRPKKEIKAIQKKRAKARSKFIADLMPSLGFGIFIGALLAIAVSPKIAVIGVVGVPIIALSLKYPRQAIWAFLIYMPFAGTVVYGLGGNAVLQLAKDGFYIPGLYGVFQACKKGRQKFFADKRLLIPLLILLAFCLATFFFENIPQQLGFFEKSNPQQRFPFRQDKSPLLLGVLGAKVFLGYIPLIFVIYHFIRNKKELLTFTRLPSILAIVCSVLAFIQYMMLSTGRCQGTDHLTGAALFETSIEARCFVGGSLLWSPSQGVVRLPGTFVAPWQWAWFLIGNAFLTYTTAFNDPDKKWRIIGLVALAGVFINAVISGQRIALVLVPACVILCLIITGQIADLKKFLPIGGAIVIAIILAFILFPEVIQERIDSFVDRWQASPANDFIEEQFERITRTVRDRIFGTGLGRATNSARMFGKVELVETWYPKVMFEVGYIGLAAFLGFVSTITWITFKAYRSLKTPSLRGIGASYWVFILFISYQTYYYPLDVDPVAVYYWVMVGTVLKLPVIDKIEQKRMKELVAAGLLVPGEEPPD
ncbi:MAG: hormogonium polysaccharide biosynthesis protein HpsL [Cyanophyceae cyanobacterium]